MNDSDDKIAILALRGWKGELKIAAIKFLRGLPGLTGQHPVPLREAKLTVERLERSEIMLSIPVPKEMLAYVEWSAEHLGFMKRIREDAHVHLYDLLPAPNTGDWESE